MNRVPDILGVYVLPLCCFVADYAAGYLGTELYPLTLWTFGAAGMTAFALSGRAMSSRVRARGRGASAATRLLAPALGLPLPLSRAMTGRTRPPRRAPPLSQCK